MEELQDLLSFSWYGTKKNRYTKDKWSKNENCRPLKDSKTTANALLTGYRQLDYSGNFKLVAVDLDKKDNWEEVKQTYLDLNLPATLTVRTPSGGLHFFFWIPKSIPAQNINDGRHCKNFELKGDNSNITAPGSVFGCGATYIIIKDLPIAVLYPAQAFKLCKFKQETVYRDPSDFIPNASDVDAMARQIDPRAKRNERGWMLRCPYHDDHRSSAVLFNSGWFYCSACGKKIRLVKKEQ